MLERLQRMPVPVLPAFVGAMTLSNVYNSIGYPWVRHLTMWAATVVLLLYIIKIVSFPKVCLEEYKTTVPCSLYCGFPMIVMILGSYYFDFVPALGKGMWTAGLAIHMTHTLIFTYRNVISKRDINTTVPSWFVTYNGILVSCVVGGFMNAAGVLKYLVYYGIVIYFILLPIMVWRLLAVELNPSYFHTTAVALSPCSLCVVSYLSIIPDPVPALVYVLYTCVLVSLVLVVLNLPKYFSFPFVPGYAGLTFPMCIGIVATIRMSGYLAEQGYEALGSALAQLSGFQIYITSMIVGYVLLNFLMMALRVKKRT